MQVLRQPKRSVDALSARTEPAPSTTFWALGDELHLMGLYPGLKFSSRIPFRNAPRQFGDIWPRNTLGRTGTIQGADVSLGQRDAALESVPANMHRTNEAQHISVMDVSLHVITVVPRLVEAQLRPKTCATEPHR